MDYHHTDGRASPRRHFRTAHLLLVINIIRASSESWSGREAEAAVFAPTRSLDIRIPAGSMAKCGETLDRSCRASRTPHCIRPSSTWAAPSAPCRILGPGCVEGLFGFG